MSYVGIIQECVEAGFHLRTIWLTSAQRQIVEWEIHRPKGVIVGLVAREGPRSWKRSVKPKGFYAVTPDCRRVRGTFQHLIDACCALARHNKE